MVKTLGIFILSIGLTIPAFSQTAATKKAAPAQTTGGSLADDKLKMLTKAWSLDSVWQFGVAHSPNAKEKADGITLMADGTLFLTEEGLATTGTWKYAAGRINVVPKNADDAKGYYGNRISFKMINLTDSKLVLEFQTPDLIRIRNTYSPKK